MQIYNSERFWLVLSIYHLAVIQDYDLLLWQIKIVINHHFAGRNNTRRDVLLLENNQLHAMSHQPVGNYFLITETMCNRSKPRISQIYSKIFPFHTDVHVNINYLWHKHASKHAQKTWETVILIRATLYCLYSHKVSNSIKYKRDLSECCSSRHLEMHWSCWLKVVIIPTLKYGAIYRILNN